MWAIIRWNEGTREPPPESAPGIDRGLVACATESRGAYRTVGEALAFGPDVLASSAKRMVVGVR